MRSLIINESFDKLLDFLGGKCNKKIQGKTR